MAANTSFKVQCPSCDAGIPIRDPNLVGKKIDCPKCKYRFVVEDPEGDAGEAAPAVKATKGKAKAKKGGNNILIVGSILGGIALIVLGVVGYMLIAGGDDSSKNSQASRPTVPPVTTPPVTAPAVTPAAATNPAPPVIPTTDAATAPAATPDQPMNPPPAPPAPTTPAAVALDPGLQTPVAEISNLLPNDAQSVLSINMDRFRSCTIGQQAFESQIGFRPETFKQGFGIGVEEIQRFIRAENVGQNWTFNVMRTARDVTLADFQPLNLKKGPKSPIRERNYFVIAPNPLVDNLATILQSELESREAKATARKKESSGPLTLALLDPKTVVVANQDVMEEFLQANAEPKKLSLMAGGDAAAPGASPSPGPTPPRRGRIGGDDGGGNPDGGPQFTDRNAYLTIEPPLKAMLDRLEQDKDNYLACLAQRLQSDPAVVNRVREATGFKQLEVNGMNVLGVGLLALNNEKCKGEVAVEFFREQTAKDAEEAVKNVLPAVAQVMGLYLGGLKIDVEGGGGGGTAGRAAAAGPPAGGVAAPPRGVIGRGPGADTPPAGGPAGGGTEGPKSSLKLERNGRMVILNMDLSLNERAYDRVYALSQGFVVRAKGLVDMAGGEPRFYELAAAGTKLRTEPLKKAAKDLKPANFYPRGTFPRGEDSQSRLSRTYPPGQRVGWMAGLLPFLGYQEIFDDVRLDESWRSEVNLKQGAVLIPQFLNPHYPRPSWRAHPPSLGVTRDLGATHFVGVAGVGADAADYNAADPALAKKLGVFGYNRQTNVKDITDGLSNTVYLIQVPPRHQRPWIAGGGATVTGIPEARSVEPFVVTEGGKRGTHVLMCDGSVRFIREDISDDVFKALCTIKGGEEIADLNTVAPKVDPKGPSLKTTEAAKAGQ